MAGDSDLSQFSTGSTCLFLVFLIPAGVHLRAHLNSQEEAKALETLNPYSEFDSLGRVCTVASVTRSCRIYDAHCGKRITYAFTTLPSRDLDLPKQNASLVYAENSETVSRATRANDRDGNRTGPVPVTGSEEWVACPERGAGLCDAVTTPGTMLDGICSKNSTSAVRCH